MKMGGKNYQHLKRTLNLAFCFVKREIKVNVTEKSIQKANPVGYRMHPNPELEALQNVKLEIIENFPQNMAFYAKN